MPIAKIEGPFLSIDVKRVLVKEITDALEKAYKYPRAVYGVIIKENSPENVANGGELAIDRKKKASGA